MAYQKIEQVIQQYRHKTCQRYFLFDLYEGDQLDHEQKSFAIGFIYQDQHTSLADDKVNTYHDKLCQHLVRECQVTIR